MAPAVPITLVGDNLDQRHKYLNSLVNNSYKTGEDFDIIKNIPEKSAVDRLYKIDLASKYRNFEYVIQNLQDDDMLFVSRALKAKWLLEKQYENIINPSNLEENIYPNMITTAVNKMQHWIHLHLIDERRCKIFYDYYSERNNALAMKFFMKCSKDDIETEINKVISKVTPHYLKMLCEKSSKVAKIFFDFIATNENIKNQYLDKQKEYFDTLRHLLKTDGNMVLDFTEKIFDKDMYKHRFSKQQTKYVMKYHRERFWQKPELYTAWILNTDGVAESLNSEEAIELVLKLAKASFLSNWFTYQSLEPLIKRLKPAERDSFKKKVFVNKDFGNIIEDWPYDTPEIPARNIDYVTIFDDNLPDPSEYERLKPSKIKKRPIRKKTCKYGKYEILETCPSNKEKSMLDKLFDEYRFQSFGKTFYELSKKIPAESIPQNRESMFFVLISKSGGRSEAIDSLLKLLISSHMNETANFRAALIRSLVKRAQIWRLPEETWKLVLKFGYGLGLDGTDPQADCVEGLHAVIIRDLLLTGSCEQKLRSMFVFKNFSTLTDYSLNIDEKNIIKTVLPKMLFDLAIEKEFADELGFRTSGYCIDKLIETLDAYKIKLDSYPGLIELIARFASKEMSPVNPILERMYNAKIARKQLFRYMFELVRTDDSFLNALRHDTSVLDAKFFAEIYGMFIIGADRFFRKLSIYFCEENGLAQSFLQELKARNHEKIHGRLIAFLLNDELVSYLKELDAITDNKNSKLLASVIRSNAHLLRPGLDMDLYGWQNIGPKYVSCKLIKSRAKDIDANIEKLLNWKRTSKTAFSLSQRTSYSLDVFIKLASIKPTAAVKIGFKQFASKPQSMEALSKIWNTIKPIIQKLDLKAASRQYIVKQIGQIEKVPILIRPDFATVIYNKFLDISLYHAMPPLCHIELLLTEVKQEFVEQLLHQFLKNDFCVDKLFDDHKQIICNKLYIRILITYLLISKNDVVQKRRVELFLDPLLYVLDEIQNIDDKKDVFKRYFSEILVALKYTKFVLDRIFFSPLPVIEHIVLWMRKRFGVAEHFKTYGEVHLLMLYYKALQQALELASEVYSDENKRRNEGVTIFGNIFGKYVASEVTKLREEYFESITDLYHESVVKFFEKFVEYYLTSAFLVSFVEGIFSGGTVPAYILGTRVMNEYSSNIESEKLKKLKEFIRQIDCAESPWFLSL